MATALKMGGVTGGKGYGRILEKDLFLFLLDLEVKRARRYQNFLSVLILKLVQDHGARKGNDGEGLETYHRVLEGLLVEEMRESDILGEVGENKWVALLPYADGPAGDLAKSRFEGLLEHYNFKDNDYRVVVEQFCFPVHGTSADDLVRKGIDESA